MKTISKIMLALAALAAGTPATRADELSELVAAVVASSATQKMADDVMTTDFSAKPRYKAKVRHTDIDVDILDGIIKSINREALRNHRKDLDIEDNFFDDGQLYYGPTLGKEFFRPVPGIITSRFGWRPQFQRLHHGVDLSLNVGDTVRAAISGTIEKIAYDHDGYGHYIVVSHPDGMQTLYGHLQYALVGQGQFIYAGQPLAIGGNTGNSTGPHLHFEVKLDGTAVDPTLIFDFYGTGRYQYVHDEDMAYVDTTPKKPTFSHQSKSLKRESTYIVRYGDTLESVARQAGTSVMRLCQLNMLNQNDPLPIGRMLKLK